MGNPARNKNGFGPKSRITHAVYGLGTVVAVSELYTTIQFDEAGTRRFVNSMVRLDSTDTPAPVRAVRKTKKKTAGPN